MSIHSDILACLDKPRTLLELCGALADNAGVSLTGRVRDGDLGMYASDMQRRGYTPSNVLAHLRCMKGVRHRDAERIHPTGGQVKGDYATRDGEKVCVLQVTEWVRA